MGAGVRAVLVDEAGTRAWDQAQIALREWYASGLGETLHGLIAARASALLRDVYALHCLQLGGTRYGVDLLTGQGLIRRVHVTGDGCEGLRADPAELPLATRSIDLVVLAHALEFHDDPHRLLREVDRVLKLDGQVLVIGFNPWSPFGIRRALAAHWMPWSGHFYGPGRIIDWMALLGLPVRWRESVCLMPPVQRDWLRRRLAPLERLRAIMPGAGGVYLMLARKRSAPVTPIPLGRDWAPTRVGVRRPASPMGWAEPPSRRWRYGHGRDTDTGE
jgi:SAM-dependent methyltransferase